MYFGELASDSNGGAEPDRGGQSDGWERYTQYVLTICVTACRACGRYVACNYAYYYLSRNIAPLDIETELEAMRKALIAKEHNSRADFGGWVRSGEHWERQL